MELPTDIAHLFATQPGGLVALRQMTRKGWDRREVASWAQLKLIERVMHGLYRRAGVPVPATHSLHLPLRYIALRSPEDHLDPVVSGGAALAVHGAEGFTLPSDDPMVLVDHRCRIRPDRCPFDVRRTDLEGLERDHVGGVAVTVPWRATADAALDRAIDEVALRVATDSLRSRRVLDIVSAVAAWRALGHAGSRRLTDMAATGVFEQESEGERRAFVALFGAGAPLPDCQVEVIGRIRVDFVFLHAGLVVEYYGRPHDGRADTDATRIAAIEGMGYRVIIITRSMLRDAAVQRARIEGIRRDRLARAMAGTLPLPPLQPQPPRLSPLRTVLATPSGHALASAA